MAGRLYFANDRRSVNGLPVGAAESRRKIEPYRLVTSFADKRPMMSYTSDAAIMFGLSLVSMILCVGLLVSWRALGGVRHALIWSGAFGLAAVQWAIIGGYNSFLPETAPTFIGSTWAGGAVSILLFMGFRERIGAPRRWLLLVGVMAATAVLVAMTYWMRQTHYALAVPQFVRATFLPLAALTLVGRRRRSGPTEIMAIVVLLGFAIFSAVVGGFRLADCGCETNAGRAVLLTGLPVLFMGTGIVIVLLLAGDLARQLRIAARTDPLTEALNRRGFEEDCADALRRRGRGQATSIVLIDLDHFKRVNDLFGHGCGDDVLRAVAACVRRHLRGDHLFGRMGGEEFALMLGRTDIYAARALAEQIRRALHDLAILPDGKRVTASFGIVAMGANGDLSAAIAAADKAMYDAKSLGRDRVCIHDGRDAVQAESVRLAFAQRR